MKRVIRSASQYYTTKKKRLPVKYIDEKGREKFKMLPGKEKSRATKNMVFDEFDVVDSYTDAIDAVYAELHSYKGSIVEPMAHALENDLRYYEYDDRYYESLELDHINKIIEQAANLDILEDACLLFEERQGARSLLEI